MNTPANSSNSAFSHVAASPPAIYAPLRPPGPIDLHLDANESLNSCIDLQLLASGKSPQLLTRYPNTSTLEAAIALRLGVPSTRVIVTAGGDEAIDRACRAFLKPGTELILPVPTFEMIERYARLAQADVVTSPWREGVFPTQAVLTQVTTRTAMISIVSPNNPTGAVAQAQDLATISAAAPHSLLLVDLAYEEFAQDPLTAAAISLPNAIIIRTFSKAFGLAGMRIGYAIVPESAASAMRATGSPYSVSSMSIAAAQQAMACPASWLSETLSRVRYEREQLRKLLLELGATPGESQGNFLLAEFRDCQWVWRALAGLGIAVRRFSAPNLQRSLRITCPGQEIAFTRLIAGLNAALRPQALFIAVDSNQDTLHRLSCRIPTAIIPRSANQSAAIQSAVQQLNASHAWMLCDTPEKIAASRAAGIVPLAIASNTADKAAFESCGAARVLDTIAQLEGMLP